VRGHGVEDVVELQGYGRVGLVDAGGLRGCAEESGDYVVAGGVVEPRWDLFMFKLKFYMINRFNLMEFNFDKYTVNPRIYSAAKFTLFHVNSREFTLFHTFSRDFT
jgi:hypothetical protein